MPQRKCKEVYIGETKRMLHHRVPEHSGYVSKGAANQPTGAYFKKPGHSLADLKVSVIEHTRGRSAQNRNKRELYLMNEE